MPNDACLGQRRNLALQLSLGSFTRFENAQTAEFALLLTANTFSRGNLSGQSFVLVPIGAPIFDLRFSL
jgi:hypothetical protein